MIIYIDTEKKCHVTNTGGLTPVETNFFEGKCPEFIEGYKYDPKKNLAFPWKPYSDLKAAQDEYNRQMLEKENTDLMTDLADLIEEVYESDVERIEE